MKTIFSFTIIVILAFGCAAYEEEGGSQNNESSFEGDEARVEGTDHSPNLKSMKPFYHPMMDGYRESGIVLTEVLDNSEGKRYVISYSNSTDEFGNSYHESGIKTVERERLSDSELEDLVQRGQRGYDRHPESAPIIAPNLANLMSTETDDTTFYVNISLRPPATYVPLIYRMQNSYAMGEITSDQERNEVRRERLLELHDDVNLSIQQAKVCLDNVGAEIEESQEYLFSISSTLTKQQILSLENCPAIDRIEKPARLADDSLDGYEIMLGTQMANVTGSPNQVQYIDDASTAGFWGNKSGQRVKVGVLERSNFDDEHPGFNDENGNSRIEVKRHCSSFFYWLPYPHYEDRCLYVSNFGGLTAQHPSAVAGIIAGDITKGQDPLFPGTNTYDQKRRSGFARNAGLYLWRIDGTIGDDNLLDNALNDVVNFGPNLISMSIGHYFEDHVDDYCLGEDYGSRKLNEVYEAGIAVFKATANKGHADSSNCLIRPPGSAIGAFVVGQHTTMYSVDTDPPDSTLNNETEVRTGPINPASSRGGTTTEGKGRTIVDMVAAGCRRFLFNIYHSYTDGHQCGSSFSTPTVAAGAAILQDYWKTENGSYLEDPGELYSLLLLMGDRQVLLDEYGNPDTAGQPNSDFDNVWGAGRFKMRRYDDYGMDSEWEHETNIGCVGDGDVLYFPINGTSTLPADVNVIKGVLSWYDARHEEGTAIDNLNLALEECVPITPFYCYWTSLLRFVSPTEEKERIFLSGNLGGRRFRWVVYGADVTATNAGCAGTAMRFYLSYFYENSDRDDYLDPDGLGPNGNIDPE